MASSALTLPVHLWRRLRERPAPVLRPYQIEPNPLRHSLVKTAMVAVLVFVGLIYGFLVAIFPSFLYLYLAFPLIFLALFVIWALPTSDRIPERAIEAAFVGYFVAILAWPDYLAIAIPGLPWITVRRLFLIPMALMLLISVSMSPRYRQRILAVMRDSPWLWRLFLGFVAIQFVTLFFSATPGISINRWVSNQMAWTATLFVAALWFTTEGRASKALNWFLVMLAFSCAVGLWEWHLRRVPWVGHIPSFLAVSDEVIQNIVSGDRMRAYTNKYRIAGIFITPLNLAEVLGLGTAFVLHAIVKAETFGRRVALLAFVPVILFTIIQTDSRLGSVAFFGSILLYGALWGVKRWVSTKNDLLSPALVLTYPAVLGVFLALSLVWRRLEVMIWGGGQQASSTEGRREQWALFWPKIQDWPFGYGTGRSGEVLGWYSGDFLSVDSYFISVSLDHGVIGFVTFFGLIIAAAVQSAYLYINKTESVADYLIIPAIVFANFIIIKSVFSQENSHPLLFMLLGLVFALTHVLRKSERAQVTPVATALSGPAPMLSLPATRRARQW